jgi:hypothetical protein
MLGEFLKKMRDHQPPEEPAAPAPPVKGFGKGQYLDVYV